MTQLRLLSCLLSVVAIIGMLGRVRCTCLIFLGVVSRYRKCRPWVFPRPSRLTVVIESPLAVSTGLMMTITWLLSLFGIPSQHRIGRSALGLWHSLTKLMCVVGTSLRTLLSSLPLVCRTETSVSPPFLSAGVRTGYSGALTCTAASLSLCATLQVSSRSTLCNRW